MSTAPETNSQAGGAAPGDNEVRAMRGTGLVNAIGITALAVAAGCALHELWRAFA